MPEGTTSAAQLRLYWSDNSEGEEGFEIERSTANTEFTAIAVVGANVSLYTDSTVANGETYCYRLRAFNASLFSDFSNIGCATTPTTVSVSKFGSGMGTVSSDPAGIECGTDCVEAYPKGTIVTLMSDPAQGSVFVGWNGAGCTGSGLCIFNLQMNQSITALFDNNLPPVINDPPLPVADPSASPLTLTNLSADLTAPQLFRPITFFATTNGGVAPLQFKWWVFDGFDWHVGQEWDTSDTFLWTPSTPGEYLVGVWARSSGNDNDGPENDTVLTQAFTVEPLTCPAGTYLAEFYNNMTLSGSPAFADCDLAINHDWAAAGPVPGVGSDNFAVRWTGHFLFSAGAYTFTATADDGMRAWVDGNLIIDAWVDQSATMYQATLELSEGEHLVQVEYYENGGGALAQFNWRRLINSTHDYYVTLENTRLMVAEPGILANDNDLNGNMLTATLVSPPTHGVVDLNSDGSFSYTPNAYFNGTDSFNYIASNGTVTGNLATVTITVTPVNDIPVAANDAFVVFANDHWIIDAPGVLGNDHDLDGDALTALLVDGTANGTLYLNFDGSFVYTPNLGFVGTDTFTYMANDGQIDSNVAMVTITVTELNAAPVAQNDAFEIDRDAFLGVAAPGVLVNDTDANNDSLTATLVAAPLFGTVTLNADGSFDYIPAANFSGTDSFTYKVDDGSADSNVAMVTITVNAGSGI